MRKERTKGAIFDGFEFPEEDILLKVKTDDGERSGIVQSGKGEFLWIGKGRRSIEITNNKVL